MFTAGDRYSMTVSMLDTRGGRTGSARRRGAPQTGPTQTARPLLGSRSHRRRFGYSFDKAQAADRALAVPPTTGASADESTPPPPDA
jgi:hypothetical protein